MATLFTRDWTAANGTSWEDVGFLKILGAAVDATVSGNKGGAGASNAERTYRATSGVSGLASYKARAELVWTNAAGADRVFGVWVRLSTTGDDGYVAELGSNTDDPRVRIRRRSGGAWTTPVAWTDVPAVTGATLNAGATLLFRVENTDADTVSLKVSVNGSLIIDFDDTTAGRVQSGGTSGIQIGPNCVTTDVLADDLTVLDFADEHATPADLAAGLSLVIDGTYYSQAEVAALGITIGSGRDSYEDSGAWTLRDRRAYNDPAMSAGAWVSVVLNGTIIAAGRVRRTAQRLEPGQGNTYQVVSLKQLASEIIVSHPDTQAGTIVYNPEADSDDYDPDLAGLTVGESIAHVLDTHLEGDGGLRDMGLVPITGVPYIQAEINAMSLELPGLTASDNVLASVEGLLSFTKRSLWIDPATRTWYFRDRMAAAARDVDLADDHVTGELGVDPDRNATAILIRGTKPEAAITTLDTDLGVSSAWEASLETTYSDDTRYKDRGSGTVTAHGTLSSKAYIDVDLAMVNHEWIGATVVFTDPGELIDGLELIVEANTTTRITFTVDWPAGPTVPIDAATLFVVEGNRHKEVFRKFKVTNPDLVIPPGACIDVKIFDGENVWNTKATVTGDPHGSGETELMLDLPAISLVNFAGVEGPDPCTANGVQMAERVEITAPMFDKTAPTAPVKRVPAAGFHGTAYTLDSGMWDGGGKPGVGDPGVMRVYPIDMPGFTSLSVQGADMQALGDEMLDVLSPLARQVVLRIHGLDETWAGLDNRLTVSRTGGSTGFEGLTDLPVMAVEWDPESNLTIIYAGTMAVAGYDLGSMRHRYNEQLRRKAEGRWQRKLEDLYRCLADSPKGAGEIGMQDPLPICAEQVKLGGGRSVKSALDTECAMPGAPPCDPACEDWPCGTVTNGANMEANALGLMALGPYVGSKAGEQMGALAKSLACLWTITEGISSSHDQELNKAGNDLASVRTNLDNLVTCINTKLTELCTAITAVDTRLTAVQACFNAALATKHDQPGAAGECDVDPAPCAVVADCSHSFTETVCETPCVQDVPVVDIACE